MFMCVYFILILDGDLELLRLEQHKNNYCANEIWDFIKTVKNDFQLADFLEPQFRSDSLNTIKASVF